MAICLLMRFFFFFFQAEDGIRDLTVTGVQTCALPISVSGAKREASGRSYFGVSATGAGFGRGRGFSFSLSLSLSPVLLRRPIRMGRMKIGRASCRERV